MINYQEKYIKYKLKYLELQGGALNRKIKIGENKITKADRELADETEKMKLQMEEMKKMEEETKTEEDAIIATELADLKEKSKKYYRNLDELRNTLKTFMSELNCCEYDIEIQFSKNISESQKKFLSILKTDYVEMSNKIRNINPTAKTISEITNYVPVEDIYSHIKTNYEPIIKNIFTLYIEFIKKFTDDIKKEKIPFYKLYPIARNSNEVIPKSCQNNFHNIPDCYLVLLGAQILTRITLIFSDFFKIINDNSIYPEDLINYIKNTIELLSSRVEIYNYIIGLMELHNYNTSYTCTYDKKKYGEINIYDKRTCPGKVKSSKECEKPCEYNKKNNTCNPPF